MQRTSIFPYLKLGGDGLRLENEAGGVPDLDLERDLSRGTDILNLTDEKQNHVVLRFRSSG